MSKKVNKKPMKIISAMLFVVMISSINAFAMKENENYCSNLNINEEIKLKQEKNNEIYYDEMYYNNNNFNTNNEITFNDCDTEFSHYSTTSDTEKKDNNYESFCDEYDKYDTYKESSVNDTWKGTQTINKLETKEIIIKKDIEEEPKQLRKTELAKKQSIKKKEAPKTEMTDDKKNLTVMLEKKLKMYYKYYEDILEKNLKKYKYYYEKFSDSERIIDKINKKINEFKNIIESITENSKNNIAKIKPNEANNINNFKNILDFTKQFKREGNTKISKENLEIIYDVLYQIDDKIGFSTETFSDYDKLSKSRYINFINEYDDLYANFCNDTATLITDENTKLTENNNKQKDENKNGLCTNFYDDINTPIEDENKTKNIVDLKNIIKNIENEMIDMIKQNNKHLTTNVVNLESEIDKTKNEILQIIKSNDAILKELNNKFKEIDEKYMNQEIIIGIFDEMIKTNDSINTIK